MPKLNLSLDESTSEILDTLVNNGIYVSKAEAIRFAVKTAFPAYVNPLYREKSKVVRLPIRDKTGKKKGNGKNID